jgi:sn-glycerol 3-phosphate transport system ATP-binding protein
MNLTPFKPGEAGVSIPGGAGGILGVRPEDLTLTTGTAPDGGVRYDLTVEAIERVGAETFVYGSRNGLKEAAAVSAKPGELPPGEIIVRLPGQAAPGIGERIVAVAPRDKLHIFGADGRGRIEL